MTLRQILQHAVQTLDAGGIEDAHFEAEVLLRHTLKISPTQLYIQPQRALTKRENKSFWQLIERRLCREPTAYILRHREFYGVDFYVDSRAFIPRPETELLVEKALDFAYSYIQSQSSTKKSFLIADIGTGSGAIAVSLALNLPQAKIYATDISVPTLEVANINCQQYKVADRVILLHGDLLEPLPEAVNLIVANLPYIKDSELEELSPEITKFEPLLALRGGHDGLNKIDQLLKQARKKLYPKGCLLLEIGHEQEKAAIALVNNYLPESKVKLFPDLSGINRAVRINF